MVRRTLEEICNERGATGADLKKRIKSLRSKVVLPDGLLDGMNELRLLGNDAAHVKAKAYADIGSDEIKLAIALTKEILKALYQLDDLLKQIQALKEPAPEGTKP